MKILVTGGTGVVGRSAVTELLRAGHTVRLLSRNAAEDAAQWHAGVESWDGSVADAARVAGSAGGCDAVLHVAGIVEEDPPEVTYDRVNVEGTRNLVQEAERAGVKRFIYVSSLGADVGESEYHRSKREAEAIVAAFHGSWLVLRPGNVYGPGDEVVSALLRMVRTLPVVPVIAGGERFQPVWHEDIARAIAQAMERDDLSGRILELAGTEVTSQEDLLERLKEITGRSPMRVPVPDFLARLAAMAAPALPVDIPLNESKLTMLLEGNLVRDPEGNALPRVFGITPTPLDQGLRLLADAQPEQLPEEGVGTLQHRSWSVDIAGSGATARELCDRFRTRFDDFVPIDAEAEPGVHSRLEEGASVTLHLPVRGNVQVRVEESDAAHVLLSTLEGHPLAGAVRFSFHDAGGGVVRFTIDVYDRPASTLDAVTMALGGSAMQAQAWRTTATKVRDAAGDRSSGIRESSRELEGEDAARVEGWLKGVVNARKRRQEHRT